MKQRGKSGNRLPRLCIYSYLVGRVYFTIHFTVRRRGGESGCDGNPRRCTNVPFLHTGPSGNFLPDGAVPSGVGLFSRVAAAYVVYSKIKFPGHTPTSRGSAGSELLAAKNAPNEEDGLPRPPRCLALGVFALISRTPPSSIPPSDRHVS